MKFSRVQMEVANYDAIYERYTDRRVRGGVAKLAHLAMAGAYTPSVHYAPGAEDAITQNFKLEKPMIVTANHVRYIDQYIIGSAMHTERALQPFVGTMFVWAKAPYFVNTLSRVINEGMGAMPVFREQDVADDEHVTALRASVKLLDVSARKLETGQNPLCFPEGTRNRGDWKRVMRIKEGAAKLACKAWRSGQDVSIVPMGIAYPDRSEDRFDWRHASLYIGEPLVQPYTNAREVTDRLQESLQHAVDQAYAEL